MQHVPGMHLKPRPRRGSAWMIALLAGFVVQLLLILLVTVNGLNQLAVTSANLKTMLNIHLRKEDLTKRMGTAARERSVNLFRMVKSGDPFERDELFLRFNDNAADFIKARAELEKLPLGGRERELLELQRRQSGIAAPLQNRVAELAASDPKAAESLLLGRAIPEQDRLLQLLAELDEETERQALAAGARVEAMHASARRWMVVWSGIALLIGLVVAAAVVRFTSRASREREHLATHDALTGLPNRMLFKDRLEQALARARRHAELVGILFIDIDRFKLVNDTLGHAGGDRLIGEVAARLRGAVRADDIVARLGGDEFVVVLGDALRVGQILHLVEKILAVVGDPYQIDGRELYCSCSIGVSIYPNDGGDSTTLIKNADTAMYHAKAGGRNRYQLYDRSMNAMAEERLQLETELHHALERDEFVFHYQPQLNMGIGRVETVEALLRWEHPQRGVLAPQSFLELLEDTGVIIDVGRRLMMDACRQTASWHAAGFPWLNLAVNLSDKEFWHADLVQSVKTVLEVSGLRPSALQLELTETIFMQDIERAMERILSLKQLGVAIAIDDFGTGYSSLAQIKRFPFDCLKIDRYFVKDIEETPANEAFIRSILALCDGLLLDSVAEGVENGRQLERLGKLGCQVVQGELISSPVPAEEVPGLLQRDWMEVCGEAGLAQA